MRGPVVVPKSSEPWSDPGRTFRVVYFSADPDAVCRSTAYFDSVAQARRIAARYERLATSSVESRDMPVSHEVSAQRNGRLLWAKRFGTYESARAEFERGKLSAETHTGSVVMIDFVRGNKVFEFTHWKGEDNGE